MRLKKSIKFLIVIMLLTATISFVGKRQDNRVCNKIIVEFENPYDNYFIDENDIIALMTDQAGRVVTGENFSQISFKTLEKRLEGHRFVQAAEVYKDLTGNLIAKVQQSMPIARILQTNAPEAYISTEGKILPVSDRYTARVLLVSGDYTQQLMHTGISSSEENLKVFNLIQYINNHEFWKAQIAQIDIGGDGNILLYPQVGKQHIEFGKAEDIEAKFRKLEIFYTKILPFKGWNTYNRVNLEYHNQIVCE